MKPDKGHFWKQGQNETKRSINNKHPDPSEFTIAFRP